MPKYDSKVQLLKCTYKDCDKEFKRQSYLTRHHSTHSIEKPHVCTEPGCTMTFSQTSALKTHMNVHTGAQPHACRFCDARFGDPSSRGRHEEEIHNPEKGSFVCPVEDCPSSIKRRSAFTHHLRAKHQICLSRSEVDSCNAMLRNQPRRARRRFGRSTGRAERARTSSTSTGSPLELPVPLAIPKLPDSFVPVNPIQSMASTPAPSGYDMQFYAGQAAFSSSFFPSMHGYDYQQDYQQSPYMSTPPATQLPFVNFHLNGFAGSIPAIGSPALTVASSASSSSSASPSPAPDMMSLYPTVPHALSMDVKQANAALAGFKSDDELDMFLASFNDVADSFGLGSEKPTQPNWFGIDHGIAVLA